MYRYSPIQYQNCIVLIIDRNTDTGRNLKKKRLQSVQIPALLPLLVQHSENNLPRTHWLLQHNFLHLQVHMAIHLPYVLHCSSVNCKIAVSCKFWTSEIWLDYRFALCLVNKEDIHSCSTLSMYERIMEDTSESLEYKS